MEHRPQVIYKTRSFLSQTVLGISVIVIAVTLSSTLIVLYGMKIANNKTDDLLSFVQNSVKSLPELQKSLPPVLADVLNDTRLPEYRDQIEIAAKTSSTRALNGNPRINLEITNKGKELVSLLSFRIVAFNKENEPIFHRNVWAATPFTTDNKWPGPLMPGSNRHLTAHPDGYYMDPAFVPSRIEVEITDVRVWNGDQKPDSEQKQITRTTRL